MCAAGPSRDGPGQAGRQERAPALGQATGDHYCKPLVLRAGYAVERIQPVDMFPHAYHIECLVQFALHPEAGHVLVQNHLHVV